MTRIFQAIPLEAHQLVTLDATSSHHLATVLRIKKGELITLFNGEGGEFPAEIISLDKKIITVKTGDHIARETESFLDVSIALGISRGEKMDYTLQKAVELGVKTIIPVITTFCNMRLTLEQRKKKLQHWQKIILHACEQCGRNRLPKIVLPILFTDWLNHLPITDHAFLFSPTATVSLRAQKIASHARVLLLTGPEGGLSASEINLALEKKFIALKLGPRILRTETAAIAAITALQCLAGDMG